jgi:hypothetical protein
MPLITLFSSETYLRLLFLVGKDYGLDCLNSINIVSSLGYPKSVLLPLPDKVGGARQVVWLDFRNTLMDFLHRFGSHGQR